MDLFYEKKSMICHKKARQGSGLIRFQWKIPELFIIVPRLSDTEFRIRQIRVQSKGNQL